MTAIRKERVLGVLRAGTADERVAFVESLPPSTFRDETLALVGSEHPGMPIVALSPTIQEYCYGRDPELGAVLAAAVHDRAVEIWETVPGHGLLATTLSGLALSHLKALSLLGRSQEILDEGERYVELYGRLGEHENLPSLEVLRIEALVNLKRIDEAHEELEDEALLRHPIAGIEARRLKRWVDSYRRDATALGSEGPPTPGDEGRNELLGAMKTAFGLAFGGQSESGAALGKLVDGLAARASFDPGDPTQYKAVLDALDKGEKYLRRGDGANSELAMRGRVRNASAIFVHGKPPPEQVRRSLAELESGLEWARAHSVADLTNDALWGIYLCNSRLQRPSEAADALIELRGSLEALRSGIRDPMKRGGVFGAYRYLFPALCEKLHQAGRIDDLLEAIESSKGRVIADRLTLHHDEAVPDARVYECVARLQELTRREGFHYLTYFVDEECVHAVLVSKRGEIIGLDPMPVRSSELRAASTAVRPRLWGRPLEWSAGAKQPDVSERLRPLVAWLEELLESGVVSEDDHICYSSDDDFHNVPLHFLRLADGIVLDRFSVSRVHSAFHLDRVLSSGSGSRPRRYVGFVAPLLEDVEKDDGGRMLRNFEAPLAWLESHGLEGTVALFEEATPRRVRSEKLDHAVVHFSTHGWFPENGNPFRESYLLLADETGLPDSASAATRAGRLTPRDILDAGLDLSGSHVSMMACLSGLAKEGIAGDILGLDWALIQAGASSLLSTHWKVSAACAARFFERFYGRWIEDGETRAAAWRGAMLELLDGDDSPDALDRWTAFSLTGDFR